MEPITLAAILGALAISSAGALYTNSQNIKYAKEANEESIALANTAHQREVRDLKAAGLNPILSASGSGSAVPQLKVPGLQNPLESVGSSAGGIANALNGLTKAEIETVQAEASSARSAAMMDYNDRQLSDWQLANSELELAARNEALTGRAQVTEQPQGEAYHNLVEQYKNEIESGRYLSSKEHAIYEDAKEGARVLIDGVNSASGFRRAASAIRRDNSAIKRDNWEMTRPRGQQRKGKHK